MRPRRTPRSSSTSARAPSTSARTRRARAAIASPASVGVTRRLVRSNSGVPSSCSSRRIWCDSADCARWSSSAARVKWRWRTTASTLRSCRSSMRSIVDHDRCGENYVLRRSICGGILGSMDTNACSRCRSSACWSRRPPTTPARRSPDRSRQRRLRDRGARALARRDHAHHGVRARRADRRRRDRRRRPGAAGSPAACGSTTSRTTRASSGCWSSAPDQRGTGVGRALVAFAERHSRERGLRSDPARAARSRARGGIRARSSSRRWYGRIGLPADPHRRHGRRVSAARAAARHARATSPSTRSRCRRAASRCSPAPRRRSRSGSA